MILQNQVQARQSQVIFLSTCNSLSHLNVVVILYLVSGDLYYRSVLRRAILREAENTAKQNTPRKCGGNSRTVLGFRAFTDQGSTRSKGVVKAGPSANLTMSNILQL